MMPGVTPADADAVYVDVATQTSPFTSPPPISLASPASPITSFLTATSLPAPAHSRSPTQTLVEGRVQGSSFEHVPLEESDVSDSSLPHVPSLPSSFGLQRQTGVRMTQSNIRTVSLPGTLYDEDLRLVLLQLAENTAPESLQQSRVVSMPEAARWKAERPASPERLKHRESEESSPDLHMADSSGSATSSAPSTPRTVIVHSLSSDPFNTPSPPPSSCDSVEFTLEDPVLLPDSFLRGSVSPPIFVPTKANKTPAVLEDDGWITWANSPPRPIPALHGPSSLPYARCPSGAEGTIIGEQSSLPRMIWGLDPNDTVTTPHISHQHQQSRAVLIKPPSDMAPRVALHQPSSVKSTAALLPTLSLAPRIGFRDPKYHRFQEDQSSKRVPLSAAPEPRPEARHDGNFCNMTREGTGLGFIVTGEHTTPGSLYERDFRDSAVDAPQLYQQWTSNAVAADIKMLSVEEEAEKQRQMTAQSWNKRYGVEQRAGSRGHPSDLIDLFTSPVQTVAQKVSINSRNPSALRSASETPVYLPTPPSSSSPQWSSVFSPKNNPFLTTTNVASGGSDPLTNFRMLSKMSETNDELSHELRRFVFENMSSSSSADSAISFRAPPITHISPVLAHSFLRAKSSLVETPVHPPGIPIPEHLLFSQSSQSSMSTRAASSQSSTPPNSSASTYTRSTLSNPRSIPLSRLRQKRGAVKLATVLEEDIEVPTNDKWPAPSAHTIPHLSLRTPSPLSDQLQPQSIEEKAVAGEETLNAAALRVKLPYNGISRAGDVPRDLDPSQSPMPHGSPKKKRLQRKRKQATSRPSEISRGFPLASEGTVSQSLNLS